MQGPVHHIELWTNDLRGVAGSFDWLLSCLGWVGERDPDWPQGLIWRHDSGVYLVLEESSDVVDEAHDRLRPGLNHLALRVSDRGRLDWLRSESPRHGWRELFADRYPHAGGERHVALFLENVQGFEIELVAGGS
ncbi:MAG: glyoxalase [Micropruina sp.]|uniref:VOC family protein n=1 Tax=Micropruina sp. TaxID=2737536 RepID=UPI0039E6E377